MFPNISGKPIELTCSEHAFPEFPDLLFGTSSDNGSMFFDATAYFLTKQLPVKTIDFFEQYKALIQSLQQAYLMDENEICKLNHEGHFLIDGNFVYLFISFVEPNFLAYINDRIHELFSSGMCISDTYLLEMSKKRLSKSLLETITENETNQQ